MLSPRSRKSPGGVQSPLNHTLDDCSSVLTTYTPPAVPSYTMKPLTPYSTDVLNHFVHTMAWDSIPAQHQPGGLSPHSGSQTCAQTGSWNSRAFWARPSRLLPCCVNAATWAGDQILCKRQSNFPRLQSRAAKRPKKGHHLCPPVPSHWAVDTGLAQEEYSPQVVVGSGQGYRGPQRVADTHAAPGDLCSAKASFL